MGGGDDEVTYYSPGRINLQEENPEAFREINNLRNLRDRFRSSSQFMLDDVRFDNRTMEAQERARTRLQNQFANMGLANSSLAVGAASESDRQIQMAYDDRQLNDFIRAMQMEAALSGQIGNNIFAIQNQFSNTQNAVNGAVQQKNAQEQAMWGDIMKTGGMIAGMALAPSTGGLSLVGSNMMNQGYGEMNSFDYSGFEPVNPGGGMSVGSAYGMYGSQPYGFGGR